MFDGGCGIRPSAAGAVLRKNSPPDCFLTRGLRIPSIHHKNKQHLQKQMLFILCKDYKKDIFGRFAYDFELSQNILSFLI